MDSKYDYLKHFKKEHLMQLYAELDKKYKSETEQLRKQLNDTQKECFEKIQDMEERHEKQMYRAWKQHVDTHYLERFLKEYLSEKLKLDVSETSGDEGWQTINVDLLLDGSRISGGEGSINTRWR